MKTSPFLDLLPELQRAVATHLDPGSYARLRCTHPVLNTHLENEDFWEKANSRADWHERLTFSRNTPPSAQYAAQARAERTFNQATKQQEMAALKNAPSPIGGGHGAMYYGAPRTNSPGFHELIDLHRSIKRSDQCIKAEGLNVPFSLSRWVDGVLGIPTIGAHAQGVLQGFCERDELF